VNNDIGGKSYVHNSTRYDTISMTRFKKLKEKIERENTVVDIDYNELETYLNHYNYYYQKCHGSHHKFTDYSGNELTIPVHKNKIKKVYIRQIVKKIKEDEK